jgi:hypothetical protein
MENQDVKYSVKIENANGKTINIGDCSHIINKGLMTLTTLLSDEKIYNQILLCRAESQNISKQIDNLRSYKDIHDLLYRLEFNCYGGIAIEARRLTLDNISVQTLIEHEYNLKQIIAQSKDVKAKANNESFSIFWIGKLEEALMELQNAIDTADKTQLQKAVRIIDRVLNIQPSQVNVALNSVAKNLDLSNLIDLMNCISSDLSNSDLEKIKIEKYKDSIEFLNSLRKKLCNIVHRHNDWHLIDVELRFFESTIDRDYAEAKDSWSYLVEQTEKQCDSSQADWVNKIKEHEKILENELFLETPNVNKLNRYFRNYRRSTGDYLYKITDDMKAVFDDLQKIDNSLTLIINMTLHDGI